MESYYEICVSLNGKHLFATAERSARTRSDAQKLFHYIREAFPAVRGFKLTITHWKGEGQYLTPIQLIEDKV